MSNHIKDSPPRATASHKRKAESSPEPLTNGVSGRKEDSSDPPVTSVSPDSKRAKIESESTISDRPRPVTELMTAYEKFVFNEIPAHMLHLPSMTLVGRKAILELFRPDLESVTREEITALAQTLTYISRGGRWRVALRRIIEKRVKYAIFSHRWLPDGEPTFQQISQLDKVPLKGPGFDKLEHFCREAEKLGLVLAWSDTCCIDKTNNTELSEAIRSMYRWYKHAQICIVHLAGSTTVDDFGSEPWFTRGWTLQELLATSQIKFFGKHWIALSDCPNDRDDSDLRDAISRVTRIPSYDLLYDSTPMNGGRIWEVMSWASGRHTTRTEDTAYCLMGMLGIYMTVDYGEGERAFSRLMEMVMQTCSSQWAVFTWIGQPSTFHSTIASSPDCYPPYDSKLMYDSGGVSGFTLTNNRLEIKMPLIPVELHSFHEDDEGICKVELTPSGSGISRANFSNVTVVCGTNRLALLRRVKGMALGILNYCSYIWDSGTWRPHLRVGDEYSCFLFYPDPSGNADPNMSNWTKVSTDNMVKIRCENNLTETDWAAWLRKPLDALTRLQGHAAPSKDEPRKVLLLELKTIYVQ
ncbi:hypothetical protein HYDPIDRAFT_27222 [Hydnomerulius pinastri MD-312]|nr:hypothetical protein HYDPIDRAFT_27222 [Hydnomerulius pinastri MD-312]